MQSARGPGMEMQPVQAGPFGLLKACSGGGQLPMPAGAPWYPGPLHNNTAGSSGQEKEVPLQASDTSQGNGGKTSEAANGADLEEASENSEGRPCLRRRASGFLGADRGEGRHSHPPGQHLFSGTKGSQGLTGRRDEHLVTDPPPVPAPQAASRALFPQEGRSCPFIHTGKKARAYSAPHAQNQAQINPSLSGMGTKVAPAAPPQRPCSPPAEGWALGFQEVWVPERIQVLTETAEAWELLSLSLGSRPREQRQSRVPPQQRLEKF